MYKDVTTYCKQCQRCRLSKEQFLKIKATMKYLIATQPNELVYMDLAVLEWSYDGTENFLLSLMPSSSGLKPSQ